jgi:hypothetical protein
MKKHEKLTLVSEALYAELDPKDESLDAIGSRALADIMAEAAAEYQVEDGNPSRLAKLVWRMVKCAGRDDAEYQALKEELERDS